MIKNWLIGLVVAVVAALVVYGIALATGDDLLVTAGGQDGPVRVPIAAVPFAVISSALGALLVAWLLKRVPRPRMTWYVVAGVVLVLSFVQPSLAAETTATAVWLCVMHVATAVPLVWFLARSLPERKAARTPAS